MGKKPGILLKIHASGDRTVIALCDAELIGKTLQEGKLHVKITAAFYRGEELPEEKMRQILEGATSINAVGKRAIALIKKLGMITEENTIIIAGVPHAQITA